MAFITLKLMAPGVKKVQTPTLVQATVVESNLIRWREGLPEKLGGWQMFFGYPIPGPIRDLWAWEDLNLATHLAAAGDQGVSVITNNSLSTIGPLYNTRNPTSIQSVAGSNIFAVNDVGSDATTYESITLQTPYSVGGVVLYPGNYQIVNVGSPDEYSIAAVSLSTGLPVLAATTDSAGTGASFTTTAGSPTVSVALANHGLSVGSNFSVVLSTSVGGIVLRGFYSIASVTAPATATASAAYTSGSTFAVSSAPAGPPVPGTLITDTTSGLPIGTFASIAGTTITINEANPLNHVASGDGLSFASGNFTFIAQSQAMSADTETYGNTTIQCIQWVVISQLPPGGGWGDGGWGLGAWGESTPPPPITGTYVTGDDWCMENFGSALVINPEDEPLFAWDPTIGIGNAQVIVPAPSIVHGFFIAMPQQMVVAFGASTQGVQDPMLVAWCDAGDYNTWLASPANQAGTYRLTRGSRIIGGLQGPLQCLLWTDVGLWLMQYIGYPDVWGFLEISRGCGLIAKKAAVVCGINVYWMSLDSFFVYSGGGATPMQCDVWDVLKYNLNLDYVRNIRAAANTIYNEVVWYYPSIASTSGENDSYIKFNVLTGEWDYGMLPVSEWIDSNVFTYPISAMPASATTSYVMQHEVSPDANGQPLQYRLKTGFFALNEAEDFVFCDYCIPDFKWRRYSQSPAISAQIELTFFVQNFPEDPNNPAVAIGPYTVTNQTDALDIRCRGRYFSVQVAGNDLGSFMRLGGLKFRIAPDGRNG